MSDSAMLLSIAFGIWVGISIAYLIIRLNKNEHP